MYIASCVHQREKSLKSCRMYISVCSSTGKFIEKKLRYVNTIVYSSMGKVVSKLQYYISSCLHQWGKSFFRMYIYQNSFMHGKVIFKFRYVYIIVCSSMAKSFQSCGIYIIFINGEGRFKVAVCIYDRVFINGESRLKVAVCIYHRVFINREVV